MRLIHVFGVKLTRAPISICVLATLLLASESIYLTLIRFNAVSTARSVTSFIAIIFGLFVLYALACALLKGIPPSGAALGIVLLGSALFRITLLVAGLPPQVTWNEAINRLRADLHGQAVTYDSYLLFDNDIWRYLWDGHVGSSGINPYAFEPNSPKLDTLVDADAGNTTWADIRANVNHRDVPTIYPPFAQVIFRSANAVAPGSVFAMKSLLVASDLVTVLLILLILRILDRPLTEVVLYAWNPLAIKVVAGSGHIDAVLGTLLLLIVFLLLREHRTLAAGIWALAVLTKITPVLLLPFLHQRIGWRRTTLGLGLVLAGYAPYLDRSAAPFLGLISFGKEWQFNSGFFSLLELLLRGVCSNPLGFAKAISALTLLVVVAWTVYRDQTEDLPFNPLAVLTLGAVFVLSPTVMPWYIVSILPLAVVARSYLWVRFSAFLCLAFLVMIDGTDQPWVLLMEWGAFAVLASMEYLQWRKEPSPARGYAFLEGASQ